MGSIRSGRFEAFGGLYEAYGRLLYTRVLMPKLGNPAAAEDALSETFRTGFERISQFEPRGTSVYFWLARIASNKAMDMHRARGVTGRALVNLEAQLAVLLEAPVTPDDVVHGKAEYLAVRERLAAALAAVNPRYRQAIELRFFEELDRERCAEALGVKLGTFDVLLLRAVKALRKQWSAASSGAVKEASDVEAMG